MEMSVRWGVADYGWAPPLVCLQAFPGLSLSPLCSPLSTSFNSHSTFAALHLTFDAEHAWRVRGRHCVQRDVLLQAPQHRPPPAPTSFNGRERVRAKRPFPQTTVKKPATINPKVQTLSLRGDHRVETLWGTHDGHDVNHRAGTCGGCGCGSHSGTTLPKHHQSSAPQHSATRRAHSGMLSCRRLRTSVSYRILVPGRCRGVCVQRAAIPLCSPALLG